VVGGKICRRPAACVRGTGRWTQNTVPLRMAGAGSGGLLVIRNHLVTGVERAAFKSGGTDDPWVNGQQAAVIEAFRVPENGVIEPGGTRRPRHPGSRTGQDDTGTEPTNSVILMPKLSSTTTTSP
jgi:hypothetical protein